MSARYRCDRPMARSKGILKYCNKKCAQCLCAIKVGSGGEDQHNGIMPQGSSPFTAKNIDIMMGRPRNDS